MLITSSTDAFADKRKMYLINGGIFQKSLFIGEWEKPEAVDGSRPDAYVVEQMPDTLVQPHYHQTEQWQVVVDGAGTLGRHAVRPVALHYTDPYTAYGPIRPAQGMGITYFSMRAKSDPGAQHLHLPGIKEAMKPSRRRFLLKTPEDIGLSTPQALRERTTATLDIIIDIYDDGVASWLLRIGPHGTASCPDPKLGGGQNVMVANGSLVRAGSELPYCSCAFVYPHDEPMQAQAGADGAELLIMQYPRERSDS